MRVALVSCNAVGTWPVAPTAADPSPWARDDAPLIAALRARGATVSQPSWSDAAIDWSAFDVAVLRSPWDYHHHRDAFVAWAHLAAKATRLVNPAPVVAWNTHKSYLRDLAVPQPPTTWVTDAIDLGKWLDAAGSDQGMLKPTVGATAEGTLRFGQATLADAATHLAVLLAQGEVMVQPYVSEVETAGERSAIVIAGEVTHWVAKRPVSGDYRVQDDYGATDHPHVPSAEERTLVEAAMASVQVRWGVRPSAGVDWLVGRGGPQLVELELVEPCLFFRHGPHAAERLAEALLT